MLLFVFLALISLKSNPQTGLNASPQTAELIQVYANNISRPLVHGPKQRSLWQSAVYSCAPAE